MNTCLAKNNDQPKVSVLIPAYNAMDYLPVTVSSVLGQTYQNFEIVIVNDGSSDNIEDWTRKLADGRIQLISQENKGLASARNVGLVNAKGQYVAFIDSDDIWLPDKLEKQVQMLNNNPNVGLVYNWVALIDENGNLQGKFRKNNLEGKVWLDLTMHNIVECGSVALVRKECFEKVGYFDESLPFSCSEDWDMWLRIAAHYDFGVLKEPLVYYRCHMNNLSSRWQAMDKSFQMVLDKAFKSAPESLQSYKDRSYGYAKLKVAWKALQNSGGDYLIASKIKKESIKLYPKIRYTKEYFRFELALLLIRLFGLNFYNNCRLNFYSVKEKISKAIE